MDRDGHGGPSTSSPSRTSAPAAPFASASGTNRAAVGPLAGQRHEQRRRARRRASRSRRTSPRRPAPSDRPPTARATSRHAARPHRAPPQRARAPRARRPGRRTGSSVARAPGPARGPCPAIDHDVARRPPRERQPDRRPPVGLDDERAAALRAPGSISAMIASGSSERGLSRGDDRQVGVRRGRRAHQGTLRAVAIPPASEHDDQATGRQRARRAQHASDAIRRVCVVHDHQEVLPRLDGLHPARHVGERRRSRRRDRLVVDARAPGAAADRRQAVARR